MNYKMGEFLHLNRVLTRKFEVYQKMEMFELDMSSPLLLQNIWGIVELYKEF